MYAYGLRIGLRLATQEFLGYPNHFRKLHTTCNFLSNSSNELQASVEFFLSRFRQHETLLENERKKFEVGRIYLAKIVGADPKSFHQEDIDNALRYLFPSGLFGKNARPKLKPPEVIFPRQKSIPFDETGRPHHHLFYTGWPNYFEVMNKAAATLNLLNRKQDIEIFSLKEDDKKFERAASRWFTKKELESAINEEITEKHYDDWLSLMKRLIDHPLSADSRDFLMTYRAAHENKIKDADWPKPEIDPLDASRSFVEAYGQKKRAFAEVRLFMPGTGNISINGNSLLDEFPSIGDREQIMTPLVFTNHLGKVDFEATCSLSGEASRAAALRLALSRAIGAFIRANEDSTKKEKKGNDEDAQHLLSDIDRLRIAGLLTQDIRYAQRKQPGQKKARKKPIWKAR